jgi:hypothetical protein
MKKPHLIAAASLSCIAMALAQTPASPPTIPFTAAEIDAIPIVPPLQGVSVTKSLFDGKTLTGWRGNLDWWSVRDGALAGKFNAKVPTNFLYTNDSYSDFRLTLSSKMMESDNHAGVCFWGEIVAQGDNKWYTHGPLVIFPNPSMWDYYEGKGLRVFRTTNVRAAAEKAAAQHEWVRVEILAQGNRVRTAFNGVQVMEWREPDPNRVKVGPVGIQLHAWTGPQEVLYKDIPIETFPREDRLLTLK